METAIFSKQDRKKHRSGLFRLLCALLLFYAVTKVLILTGHATRHMQSLLIPICINALLAVSLNLVIGFLGELSLGHAGFMSVGAYRGCLFSIYFRDILPAAVRFPAALLFAGCVAAVFGALVGIPVLRLHGDYLAIVTLAFGEILRSVIINLDFTGGASGLKGMPMDSTFERAFICLVIAVTVISHFVNSKHGRAVTALRDNSIAARAVGINGASYKLLVFTMAAFFAGVAGALYGHNYSIITAGLFDYNKSIEILLFVVLGGMGNIAGSVAAAALITVLPEFLRTLGLRDYRMLIYSVVLIALMLVNTNPKFVRMKEKFSLSSLFGKGEKEGPENV